MILVLVEDVTEASNVILASVVIIFVVQMIHGAVELLVIHLVFVVATMLAQQVKYVAEEDAIQLRVVISALTLFIVNQVMAHVVTACLFQAFAHILFLSATHALALNNVNLVLALRGYVLECAKGYFTIKAFAVMQQFTQKIHIVVMTLVVLHIVHQTVTVHVHKTETVHVQTETVKHVTREFANKFNFLIKT